MSRGVLFGISVLAHVGLAASLGRIERPVERRATSISVSESVKKKPEPPKPPDAPPPPDKEPPQRAAPRAKAAPVEPKPQAEAPPPPSSSPSAGDGALDGLPDFGLSLSGGTGGPGLAVPAGGGGRPGGARAAAPEKVTKRPQAVSPKQDVCDEPLVKPRPKNVPSAAYTEAGRTAGIEGKVRVEITVDDEGRVVSVRVLQGLGHGLDEAALDAARRATFEPATRCGKAVGATFNLALRFQL